MIILVAAACCHGPQGSVSLSYPNRQALPVMTQYPGQGPKDTHTPENPTDPALEDVRYLVAIVNQTLSLVVDNWFQRDRDLNTYRKVLEMKE